MVRKNVRISDMRRTYADVLPADLKQLREEAGYSQAQLAKLLDLSLVSIKKYESGEVAPSIEVLTKMSELYDVDFLISHKAKHPLVQKKKSGPEGA
jgi:transcriptional regulator with XRE-family HTH domain